MDSWFLLKMFACVFSLAPSCRKMVSSEPTAFDAYRLEQFRVKHITFHGFNIFNMFQLLFNESRIEVEY